MYVHVLFWTLTETLVILKRVVRHVDPKDHLSLQVVLNVLA